MEPQAKLIHGPEPEIGQETVFTFEEDPIAAGNECWPTVNSVQVDGIVISSYTMSVSYYVISEVIVYNSGQSNR